MINPGITRRAFFAGGALALCGTALEASGRGKKAYLITFHIQGSRVEVGTDSVENMVGDRLYYFRRRPEITDKNFESFQPFPSPVGVGWGATFLLDKTGQKVMYMLGEMNEGMLLKAAVNGTPVDFSVIDRVPNPRTLTIWRGLKPELIELIDKKLPRIQPKDKEEQPARVKPSRSDNRSRREVQELPLPPSSSDSVPYNPY